MKEIKKILTIVLLALLCINIYAQDKKVEFGFMGGYGYTMPKLTDDRSVATPTIEDGNLHGFHIGPAIKFNINETFGIQTGLLYSYFGGTDIENSQIVLKKLNGTYYQSKINLNTFDVPIRLVYSLMLADEFYVLFFAGPNINYALSKTVNKQNFVEHKRQNSSKKATNIYSSLNYNALDLQMGGGVGLQWMNFSIRAGYDWGIFNRTTIDNAVLRSNDVKISLGYTF